MTAPTQQLRLALGMRGGVSLAVWIGGAVSEIDLLRRAGDAAGIERAPFWDSVRKLSLYDDIIVDVLAGASAGGLNGVLYASSIAYGFDFSQMREVWLKSGGTQSLLRSELPNLSLFDGDRAFLAPIYDHLQELVASAESDADPDRVRVTLSLSGTLLEPVDRIGTSPDDEGQVERRAAGGFHFEQNAEDWQRRDIRPMPAVAGEGEDEPRRRNEALARLALAARSTSSFPVAFEPSMITATRPERFTRLATSAAGDPGALPGGVEMSATFLDRSTDRRFVVADGGILDNIPLERAVRDIIAAPAEVPTRRVLLYLQPGTVSRYSPPTLVEEGDARRAVPAIARGIAGAVRSEETIAQDMAAIEQHARSVQRARDRRGATFRGLENRVAFERAAQSARTDYGAQRGFGDAAAIVRLLNNPLAELGRDPFPKLVAGERIRDGWWRSPLSACTMNQRLELADALWTVLDKCYSGDDVAILRIGVDPLARVTRLLLDWVWYLEHRLADVGEQKRSLYRVSNFLDTVLRDPTQWAWVAATALGMHSGDDDLTPGASCGAAMRFVEQGVASVDQLCWLPPDVDAADLSGALRGGGSEPIVVFAEAVLERIDTVVEGWLFGTPQDPMDAHRDVRGDVVIPLLVTIANELRELAGALATDDVMHPGSLLHRCLAEGGDISEDTLGALEVLCQPEFAVGTPCQAEIEFRRISAANRVPIADSFTVLLDAADAREKWWDPKNTVRPGQEGIHVELKLAGNELANFSAFLLPEWRANDWLWGRLDAVPTLVDLLVTPASLRSREMMGGAATGRLRNTVVREAPPTVQPLLQDFFDARAQRIAKEFEQLAEADDVDIPMIREVLIARRQWEILDDELRKKRRSATEQFARRGTEPLVFDAEGDKPGRTVADAVKGYDVGAQTTRDAGGVYQNTERAAEVEDRFREIVDRASEVLLDNLDKDLGGPLRNVVPPKRRTTVLGVLRWLGMLGVRRFLPRDKPGALGRRRAMTIVIAAAIVALALYAVARDAVAFGIGAGLVAVALVFFWWQVTKIGKRKRRRHEHRLPDEQ